MNPILTICIPTYNRSNYLVDTIKSIITQPEFLNTDEVEIVISDNCSTDDTEQVVREFLGLYPSKIKYLRNAENIKDGNFERVLSLGSGKMLKLNNDTLILNKGCLSELLKITKYCLDNNLTPFFLNGKNPKIINRKILNNKSSFVSEISFISTWIGGFCISKASFDKLTNFSKEAHLQLVQVDILMRLIEAGCHFLMIPDVISTSLDPPKKGGYNLTEVFLTNYFQILTNYLVSEDDTRVLNEEKKKMLYNFILPVLVNVYIDSYRKTSKFFFDKTSYRQDIKTEFSTLTLIYFECYLSLKLILSLIKLSVKSIIFRSVK